MMNKGFACVLSVLGICSYLATAANAEEVVAQASLEFRPTVVGIDTALNRVYLPGISFETGEKLLGIYNVHNGSQTVLSLAEPDLVATGVAVNSNNGRVYLRGDTRLVVFDGYSQDIVKTVQVNLSFDFGVENIPENVAVNESTNRVFLVGYTDSNERELIEYDEDTDAITRIPLGEFDPRTMVVNSTSSRVYVAGNAFPGERQVLVFDGDGTLLETLTIPTDPVYMAVNSALNRVYIAGYRFPTNERELVIIDGDSNSFTSLPFGENDPFDLEVSSSSGRLFAPSFNVFGESSVQIFDSRGTLLPPLSLNSFFFIGEPCDASRFSSRRQRFWRNAIADNRHAGLFLRRDDHQRPEERSSRPDHKQWHYQRSVVQLG